MLQSTTASALMAIVLLLASGTANVYAAPTPGDLKPIDVRQANILTANPNFDEPWEITPSEESRDDAANALKKAGGKRSPEPEAAIGGKFDEGWLISASREDAAKALKKAGGKRSPDYFAQFKGPWKVPGGKRSPEPQTANPKFDEPWMSGSRDDAANALKKADGGR